MASKLINIIQKYYLSDIISAKASESLEILAFLDLESLQKDTPCLTLAIFLCGCLLLVHCSSCGCENLGTLSIFINYSQERLDSVQIRWCLWNKVPSLLKIKRQRIKTVLNRNFEAWLPLSCRKGAIGVCCK